MDPFAPMAGQLLARPEPPAPPVDDTDSKVGRMRQELREHGPRTARDLAALVGLRNTAKISAILKKDRQAGRVLLADGFYIWNEGYVEPLPPCDGRTRVRDVLDWHEVADDEFPDADLTVLVRCRDPDAEPVWLGWWDGEEWREASGLVVDVVRWTHIPKGGDV